jgi:hypothetical protein
LFTHIPEISVEVANLEEAIGVIAKRVTMIRDPRDLYCEYLDHGASPEQAREQITSVTDQLVRLKQTADEPYLFIRYEDFVQDYDRVCGWFRGGAVGQRFYLWRAY